MERWGIGGSCHWTHYWADRSSREVTHCMFNIHFNIILACSLTFARYPPLMSSFENYVYIFLLPPSPCLFTTIVIWECCTLVSYCHLCSFLHSSIASCVFTPYSLKLVALNHIQSVFPAPSPAPPRPFFILLRVGPLMSLMSLPPEDRLMSMEQWWNDNDGGHPTYLDRNLSYCHFVHHRFRMNYCGSKPSSSLWEANE